MVNTTDDASAENTQRAVLTAHDVPEQFLAVASYFAHPPFPDSISSVDAPAYSREQQLAAIEFLLWKWKTPLSNWRHWRGD